MHLILLPGLDGTGTLFESLLASLRSDLSPVVCSYPGDRIKSYSELVKTVTERLPKDKPYMLLGESYGGPLALMVAAHHAEGLRGLILSASFVSCPQKLVPEWAANLIIPAPFALFTGLTKVKLKLEGYSTPELQALLTRTLRSVRPEVLAARVREVIRVDVRNQLLACPVPILYLQGRRDFAVPPTNLSQIKSLRPDVRSVQFDAPHMVLQIAAAEAARAIEDFADECGNID